MDTLAVAKLLAAANVPSGNQKSNEWFNRVDAAYYVRLENFSHFTTREQIPKILFEFTILGNGGVIGANSVGSDCKVMCGFQSWQLDRAISYVDAIINGGSDGLASMDEATRVNVLQQALEPSAEHDGRSMLSGREAYLFTKETNTASREKEGKPNFQLITMKALGDDPDLVNKLTGVPF